MSRYLSTLTLSLYVFNLFCLPFLDGSLFFSAILDSVGGGSREPVPRESILELADVVRTDSSGVTEDRTDDPDLEPGYDYVYDGEAKTPAPRPRRKRLFGTDVKRVWRRRMRMWKPSVERGVRYLTMGLMCACVVGMAWTQDWTVLS